MNMNPSSTIENNRTLLEMPGWTHLVRFQAVEDGQIHLGQLVNISQDVGIDSVSKTEIKVFKVKGDIFTGIVTDEMLTVDHVG